MSALLLAILLMQAPGNAGMSFNVRHDHAIGSCEGTLTFTDSSIFYETKNEDHSREWKYADVKFFEILSKHNIAVHSYESQGITRLAVDRDYGFSLVSGEIDDKLYELFLRKSPRSVVSHVIFHGTEVVQEIPVRHRHLIGGCQGVLTIATDQITLRTDDKDHSREWQLSDIQSFASIDKFSLRLSSRFETFTFDLKVRLEDKTYDVLWHTVYVPGVQTYRH